MPDFKYAIFMFEDPAVAADLKVIDAIAAAFHKLPQVSPTLAQVAHNLEEAGNLIDDFKRLTCGSPYSLAIINLNMVSDPGEVDFLLRRDVLGNPRTIFLASLKYVDAEAYALARDKVQREEQAGGSSTSCVDCYGPGNRDEVPDRISRFAAAYLREIEERERARREGRLLPQESSATEILRKSDTTFYGKTMRSGSWAAVRTGTGASGRFKRPDGPPSATPPPKTNP
ncbi:MAG: hypothetical protein ABSE73_28915 [Planctomycetota bacterium]